MAKADHLGVTATVLPSATHAQDMGARSGSARDTPRPAVAIAGPIRPFPNEPPVAALEVLTLESAAVSDLPLHDLRAHGLRNTLSTNGTAQLSLVHANRPY